MWCREHGRKRAPKAAAESLIKRAIELTEAEIPKARGKISAEAVSDRSHLEPSDDVVEYVTDYMFDARREIIELARK